MASLPDDYWVFDERSQALMGKRSRAMFQLAQSLQVRLLEAKPVTGGLLFGLDQAAPAARGPKRPLQKKRRR
jgi:ribonuclease R